MKLIESSVDIIKQESGLIGAYKQIEIAGRTCYKSEDKIEQGSAKKMVDFLVKRGHGSPLEHGTIYLKMFMGFGGGPYECYKENKYSKVNIHDGYAYITTNARVLTENDWTEDLKYICDPTKHHEKRITVRFICSRSIANEIVRHRSMSFCQESQRYCSYNLGKFDGEITYIIPEWVKNKTKDTAKSYDSLDKSKREWLLEMPIEDAVSKHMICLDRAVNCWYDNLKRSEEDYMYLITTEELKPQEARSVLNNDCKTDLVVTGFVSDWKHFFELRCAPSAHPDVRILADKLKSMFIKNKIM